MTSTPLLSQVVCLCMPGCGGRGLLQHLALWQCSCQEKYSWCLVCSCQLLLNVKIFKEFLATPLFFLCQLLLTRCLLPWFFSRCWGARSFNDPLERCDGVLPCKDFDLSSMCRVRFFVYGMCCRSVNVGNLQCCFCRAHRRW